MIALLAKLNINFSSINKLADISTVYTNVMQSKHFFSIEAIFIICFIGLARFETPIGIVLGRHILKWHKTISIRLPACLQTFPSLLRKPQFFITQSPI